MTSRNKQACYSNGVLATSLFLAAKVARVSLLLNKLQLVRRLLTIRMSQIVMSNADKINVGKKANYLPTTGGTCNQNSGFLCMFKVSFTRISGFLCMTHTTGVQR